MSNFLIEKAPKEVFRFVRDNHKCVGCGKCCYCKPIVLNSKDIRVMACKLGVTVKEFKKQYTERYPGNPGLSHFKKEAPCVFLDENNRCKIYDARPDICRQYPIRQDRNIPNECAVVRDLVMSIVDERGKISPQSLFAGQLRRKSKNENNI